MRQTLTLIAGLLLLCPLGCTPQGEDPPDPGQDEGDAGAEPNNDPNNAPNNNDPNNAPNNDPNNDPPPEDAGGEPDVVDCVPVEAFEGVIDVPGHGDRKAAVHIPARDCGPAPVILALHGGGHDRLKMAQVTCAGDSPRNPPPDVNAPGCLNAVAGERGFAVVYPDGTAGALPSLRFFNGGGGSEGYTCTSGAPCEDGVDEVAYFTALLDALEGLGGLDVSSVYVTGASNGAAMSHRMACEMPDRVRAIAPAGGGNQFAATEACEPDKPMPVFMIHGDADDAWPLLGGPGRFEPGEHVGIPREGGVEPSTTALWLDLNGCEGDPEVEALTNTTTSERWACAGGAEVTLLTIAGGGHTWPGGWQYAAQRVAGDVDRSFNASEVILDFFERH